MQPPTKAYLTNLPIVDLGDLLLRPVQYDDYKDMFEYAQDDDVTKYLAWDSYHQIEEAIRSVQQVFLSRPANRIPAAYAIFHKADHKMIGTCDFFKVDWAKQMGEIGYVLNKHYWNKGYMTRVLKELIRFGFEYLDLKYIEIRHLPENIGSKRVIEKCGFRYISDQYYAKMERDIPSYELTRDEYVTLYHDKNQ